MKSSAFLAAILALVCLASGEIAVYRAGRGNRKIRTLYHGSCLPWKYFTVVCTFPKWPGTVSFYVNGKYVRRENAKPYAIAGDFRGYLYPWTGIRAYKLRIACVPRYGRRQAVTVYKHCPRSIPVWRPKPRRVWKPKPRVWRPKRAYKPRVWRPKPAYKPRVWRRKPVYRPKPRPVFGIRRKFCVVIPFWKTVGKRSRKWVMGKHGITYEPHSNFHGTYKGGTDPLVYKFRVPRVGRYGVTLDMTTRHWTEFNDVFLKMNSGFDLRRPGQIRRSYGYTKAYHNKNGRAVEAYSVDNNGHSFSTTKVLYPWNTYTIIVGARSTRLTLHRIIMFPCNGRNCEYTSSHWQKYVNVCK